MRLPAGGSRLALSLALIGVAVVGGVRGDAAPTVAAAVPAAVPPEPDTWPVPDLVSDLEDLLTYYYGQRADATIPLYYFAPEYERDKADAAKDPDTLWEYMGDPDTQCHAAATDSEFVDCTGHRLAAAHNVSYIAGGPPALFDAAKGFYTNLAYASTAGCFGLYHAFVYDYDASCADPCTLPPGSTQRDSQTYHKRMLRAYETHMRDIIYRMFKDTRSNAQFQFDLTRSVGMLASDYVRIVQAMEEAGAWASGTDDRGKAIALVNAMNQRIWWEWVVPQPEGPRTAGLAEIGSRGTYDGAALRAGAVRYGTYRFVYGGETIESLRPASQDVAGGSHSGLWFDADYTVPGEFWCDWGYAVGSDDYNACMAKAQDQSLGGTRSPYGQYYGPADCTARGGSQWCGSVNLGSMAEEWMWTYVGARVGMYLVKQLVEADPVLHPGGSDPDAPTYALGPAGAYDVVTERLGFGVSGFHGGSGFNDDMEWGWNQSPGHVQAIRTLSAGRHDCEAQNGRYSLGEDEPAGSSALCGDTWDVPAQEGEEFPGGMENHAPGPHPAYGALLFRMVLTDRADQDTANLSPSLYDQHYRNHPDEFANWIWLALASTNRCTGVSDPADNSCIAIASSASPAPTINRVPLYSLADTASSTKQFDYLWRRQHGGTPVIAPDAIADAETNCRGDSGGLPWRGTYDWATATETADLVDELGYGAHNESIQILGGLMRLIAARYPLEAVDPSLQADYEQQRRTLLEPYYDDAYMRLAAILEMYRDSANGYGYVPEIENSTCAGFDPDPSAVGANKMMLTWQVGTGGTVEQTAVRRATWYSIAALWYWWYDSDWLDVDADVW